MSTLIVYATKHGTTEKCAKSLAEKIGGDVQVVNIRKDNEPCLHYADTIAVGGPVYAGHLQKKVAKFIESNSETLREKKLALFMCGLTVDEKEEREQIERVFPEDLRNHAVSVENFGGEINWDDLGFLEKTAMKMVAKESGNISRIKPEAIDRMAEALK